MTRRDLLVFFSRKAMEQRSKEEYEPYRLIGRVLAVLSDEEYDQLLLVFEKEAAKRKRKED